MDLELLLPFLVYFLVVFLASCLPALFGLIPTASSLPAKKNADSSKE